MLRHRLLVHASPTSIAASSSHTAATSHGVAILISAPPIVVVAIDVATTSSPTSHLLATMCLPFILFALLIY